MYYPGYPGGYAYPVYDNNNNSGSSWIWIIIVADAITIGNKKKDH